MFCEKCGSDLPAGAEFCPYCGEKIENVLPSESVTADREKEKTLKRTPLLLIAGGVALLAVIGVIIFFNTPQYKYKKAVSTMLQAAEVKDYDTVCTQFEKAYDIEKNTDVIEQLMALYDAQLVELMQSGIYDEETQSEMDTLFQSRDNILAYINDEPSDTLDHGLFDAYDYVWISDKKKTENYFILGQADWNYSENQYEEAISQYDQVLSYAEWNSTSYSDDLKNRATVGIINSELVLAGQLAKEQDYDAALEKYDYVLTLDPKSDAAYIGKSNLYLYQDDVLQAMDVLNQGIAKGEGSSLSEGKQFSGDDSAIAIKLEKGEGSSLYERKRFIRDNSVIATKVEYDSDNSEFPSTQWDYNEAGQIVKETDFDRNTGQASSSTQYTYDNAGNLSREEQENWARTYTYYEDGTLHEKHWYDNKNGEMSESRYEVYDNLGRLVKVWDRGNTTEYEFGNNGRLAKISKSDESGVYWTEVYNYYDTNILKSIVTSNLKTGENEEKKYNELGFLLLDSGLYEYNDLGEIVAINGFNARTTFSYDEKHRLISYYFSTDYDVYHTQYVNKHVEEGYASGGTTGYRTLERKYTYDEENRMLKSEETSNVEWVNYVDSGSARYDDGIIHYLVNGHHWFVPQFRTETKQLTRTLKYESCAEDDPDREPAGVAIVQSELPSDFKDCMDWEPYYTCNESYKIVDTAKKEPDCTYNDLGDVVEQTKTNGTTYYEYTYHFIGSIE